MISTTYLDWQALVVVLCRAGQDKQTYFTPKLLLVSKPLPPQPLLIDPLHRIYPKVYRRKVKSVFSTMNKLQLLIIPLRKLQGNFREITKLQNYMIVLFIEIGKQVSVGCACVIPFPVCIIFVYYWKRLYNSMYFCISPLLIGSQRMFLFQAKNVILWCI